MLVRFIVVDKKMGFSVESQSGSDYVYYFFSRKKDSFSFTYWFCCIIKAKNKENENLLQRQMAAHLHFLNKKIFSGKLELEKLKMKTLCYCNANALPTVSFQTILERRKNVNAFL